MASSTIYHARSISLPSRPHPVAEQLDEQLRRLRSSEAASTSSVGRALDGLKDLYSCVDELLQLPLNQQALCQTRDANLIDQILDGSLRLLDICSASKDALQISRECLNGIQSALRRRSSGELTITREAVEYLKTRRSVKKAMKTCLKSLKQVSYEQNDEVSSLLKDVQGVTTEALKSLVSCVGGSHKNGWSVIAKLIKKDATKDVGISCEFYDVDAILNSLVSQKKNGINTSQMEILRSQSLKLESEIQDLDEALESLFRNLVKTRATLLNIFSY